MNQKNAVITGASSGIGAETIRALVEAGFVSSLGPGAWTAWIVKQRNDASGMAG